MPDEGLRRLNPGRLGFIFDLKLELHPAGYRSQGHVVTVAENCSR
jgi:hypothetical protein